MRRNVQHVCVCGHKVGCKKYGKETGHVHSIALAERCWETGEGVDGERLGAEVLYRRTGPMFGDVGDCWSAGLSISRSG